MLPFFLFRLLQFAFLPAFFTQVPFKSYSQRLAQPIWSPAAFIFSFRSSRPIQDFVLRLGDFARVFLVVEVSIMLLLPAPESLPSLLRQVLI